MMQVKPNAGRAGHSLLRVLSWTLAVLLIPAVSQAVPTDYLVIQWRAGQGLEPLYHRVVDLPEE